MNIKLVDLRSRAEIKPGRPTSLDEDVPLDSAELIRKKVIAPATTRTGEEIEKEVRRQITD
jgi:hypothetical protein